MSYRLKTARGLIPRPAAHALGALALQGRATGFCGKLDRFSHIIALQHLWNSAINGGIVLQ